MNKSIQKMTDTEVKNALDAAVEQHARKSKLLDRLTGLAALAAVGVAASFAGASLPGIVCCGVVAIVLPYFCLELDDKKRNLEKQIEELKKETATRLLQKTPDGSAPSIGKDNAATAFNTEVTFKTTVTSHSQPPSHPKKKLT